MAPENQLDINKTFESQKDLVTKTIVPSLMKVLDLGTYPVGEGVVYEMIHRRHRHQRDNLRSKNKSESDKKREAERKHSNSRRLEVNINVIFFWQPLFIYGFLSNRKKEGGIKQ
jgi:hypothetical protein